MLYLELPSFISQEHTRSAQAITIERILSCVCQMGYNLTQDKHNIKLTHSNVVVSVQAEVDLEVFYLRPFCHILLQKMGNMLMHLGFFDM